MGCIRLWQNIMLCRLSRTDTAEIVGIVTEGGLRDGPNLRRQYSRDISVTVP